jgi:hypothetical protein
MLKEETVAQRQSETNELLSGSHFPLNGRTGPSPQSSDPDSAREIARLRAEIAALQVESAVQRANLANISSRPSVRFLDELCHMQELLMPRGSRRSRIGAACHWTADCLFSGALSVIEAGRTCVHKFRALRNPNPASPDPGVRPDLCLSKNGTVPFTVPAAEATTAVASSSSDASQPSSESNAVDPLRPPYRPLTWRLKDEDGADARFLSLMILSAGQRAGSTLLQRICNARKGTLIWGEHGGLLRHFAPIYAHASYFALSGAEERDAYFRRAEDPNLWIASMSPELDFVHQAIADSARALMRTMYGQYSESKDVIGFKEVRYRDSEAELLLKCYPEARFFLLIRNPLSCWKSMPPEWGWTVDQWGQEWNAFVQSFQTLASAHTRCRLIRYEDLVRQDPQTMATLAEVAQVSERQVQGVLANKIGSTADRRSTDITDADRDVILGHCRKGMDSLGY